MVLLTKTPRHQAWTKRLTDLADQGLERRLRCIEPISSTTARYKGRNILIACSNDYLGIAHHPKVVEQSQGRGSGSSRLISGHRPLHKQLELELSQWLGRSALFFPSGFQANLAVFSTACVAGQRIASDALNHASIIDGIRLSKAQKSIVAHLDPTNIPPDTDLIAIEGLFSMDGDSPDLTRYPKEPWLAVDEAHALGCIGPDGRGVAAAQGIEPDILIGTFGKALGAAGAFVVAHSDFIDLLINAGRAFIYTTAPPEPVARMALNGLAVLREEGQALREQLQDRTAQFRQGLLQLGLKPLGNAHIVPVVLRDQTMSVAETLLENGFYATGIRYPTVAHGEERIRFTLSAAHTSTQIEQLLDALDQALNHR